MEVAPRVKKIHKAPRKEAQKNEETPVNRALPTILGLRSNDVEEVSTVFTDKKYIELEELNGFLKRQLEKSEYTKLTKIQALSYQTINEKKDCVLKSETGSGKTLAYLIPLLNSLMSVQPKLTRNDGIKILIICPIRELCLQIQNTLLNVGRACVNLVSGSLIGGEDIKSEKERIRKGLSIVVGTPGRILYHLQNTQNFSLASLTSIVFEECDRTLDMGFSKEIKALIQNPKLNLDAVQRIMVSASISDQVEDLLRLIARSSSSDIEENYEFIGFEGDRKSLKAPSKLKHFYIYTEESKKLANFFTILKLIEDEKIIIFVSTADQANFVETLCCNVFKPTYQHQDRETRQTYNTKRNQQQDSGFDYKLLEGYDQETIGQDVDSKFLSKPKQNTGHSQNLGNDFHNQNRDNFIDMPVHKIHGHMQQKERTFVFDEFRKSKSGVLICTDVGSRGLDFTDTKIIILFDVSPSYKDYINRVGRTARIDKEGASISLLYPPERVYADKLVENCQAKELVMDDLEAIFQTEQKPGTKNINQFVQFEINNCIFRKNLGYLSRRAFNSFCRAYSRLKDEVAFSIKNLNLTGISKSYGLKTVLSRNDDTKAHDYKQGKDAKDLSISERAFLERKKNSTIAGVKKIKDRSYMNSEFM